MTPFSYQIALLCAFLPFIAGCSEGDVVEKIFAKYTKFVRPVKKQNTTIIVDFELKIYNIISINAPDESINLLLWTTALWYDEHLTWKPDDFGGCTYVRVHGNQIWTPNIYFTNALEIHSLALSAEINFITIFSDGQIRLHLKYNVRLRCSMAIQRFPFDTQTCPINIGLWTYNYSEVVLHLRYPVYNLTPVNGDPNFIPIMSNASEFETVAFKAYEVQSMIGNQGYSELQYKLGLKRRPEYYIYVLLVPAFLLSSVCIIGIFTPSSNINERFERVTLGLTTLLSMAVILNIVASEMPKSAEGLPLLGIFVLYEIGVCTFAIILSTCVIITHQRAHTRGWRPTKLCCWIARAQSSKFNRVRNYDPDKDTMEKKFDGAANQNNLQRPTNVLHGTFSVLRATLENIDRRMRADEERVYYASIWQMCCDHIDSVLLVSLLLLNTAGAACILFF